MATRMSNQPGLSSLTPFVGRQAELEQLRRLLADPLTRLVTLLGPGGVGKTRLACELAAVLRSEFAHGAVCVPLAGISTPAEFLPALAEALDLQLILGSQLLSALQAHLASRQLLLVLDNFEHLLPPNLLAPNGLGTNGLAAGALDTGSPDPALWVRSLLAAAPGLKILVTSRQKLDLQGETLVHLQGLGLPAGETLDEARQADAVRLFLQQARLARPDFTLDAPALPAVVRICRLVDGVPLGLLLAAAWCEYFSPQEIAAQITQDLDFLSQELRDLPPRHRSLRAVFAASYARLGQPEQAVFARLSVFRAGFTAASAAAVAGASLAQLLGLVRQSLLWRSPATGRYELHELLRQFAAEKLSLACSAAEPAAEQTATEQDALHAAHARYFVAFLEQRETPVKSAAQMAALDEIQADLENIRQAWEWIVARRDFAAVRRAVRTLYAFCDMRSRYHDGELLFRLARDGLAPAPGAAPHPLLGLVLLSWYDMLPYANRPAVTEALTRQAQACLAASENTSGNTPADAEGAFASLVLLGAIATDCLDHAAAIALYQAGLQRCPPLDDFYWVNLRIGISQQLAGQYQAALASFQVGLERGQALGERVKTGWSLLNMGHTLFLIGEHTRAEDALTRAQGLFETIGTVVGVMWANYALAGIALVRGDRLTARHLADAARQIANQVHSHLWVGQLDDFLQKLNLEPAAPPPELPSSLHPAHPVPLIEPLSARELEVLHLLQSDLDGPDIARRLHVSLNTVRFHSKNIYRKLGVNNRREAVRRAEELEL